jgi:hypothetical protein
MLSALDIWNVALASREDGGATIDPFTGVIIDLEEAAFDAEDYFVSLPSHEYPCCPDRLLLDITTWCNSGAVEEACQAGVYIGLWWEGDTCYLDLTEVINGEQEAIRIGKARKQQAIFHIASQTCIDLNRAAVA